MINDILGLNEQQNSDLYSLEETQISINNYENLSESAKLKTEKDFKKALDEAKHKKFKKSNEVKAYVYIFISMIAMTTGLAMAPFAPTIGFTIYLIGLIYSLAGAPKNKLTDLNDIKNKVDKNIRKLNDKKRKCKNDKEIKDIEKRIDALTKISNECKKNIDKVQDQIETHNYDEHVHVFNIIDSFINESESETKCDNCKDDDSKEDKVEEKCNIKHESITGLI